MKNTCLTSEEIITSFLNYLDNTIYSYAYMLDGSWGSGKTFFVKNMLIPAIEKREREKKISDLTYKEKKILYVSLYGIKDTEVIQVSVSRLNSKNSFEQQPAPWIISGKADC